MTDNKKILLHRIARAGVFTLVWVSCWIGSTLAYARYVGDIGATYWSLGVFAYPLILGIYFFADKKLVRQDWGFFKLLTFMLVGLLLAILSYPFWLYWIV